MDRKRDRAYNIDIYELPIGVHDFDFEFNSQLFEDAENTIATLGSGRCKVRLDKSETLITLLFEIKAEVELICDRSMEKFMYPLQLKERLILNYGEKFDSSNDDVWIIPKGLQTLNIKDNILEFIHAVIPMKRLHPKFGEDNAEGIELVYSSDVEEETAPDEYIEPRWAALAQLKKQERLK